MYEVQTGQFTGPLDLLLQLIEREELDITEVSLAKVTDQYIERLEALLETPPEELADFLVVGARLLYLKSKMLLPLLVWEQEEEPGDLETRLRMYKEYAQAALKVQAILGQKRHTYVREKPPVSAMGFAPPKDLTADKMAELFRDVLKRLIPVVKVPEALIEKTVSIHEKIRHIHEMLKSAERVSFLALLELVKERQLGVTQADHFGEIHFEKYVAKV